MVTVVVAVVVVVMVVVVVVVVVVIHAAAIVFVLLLLLNTYIRTRFSLLQTQITSEPKYQWHSNRQGRLFIS